MVGWMRTVCIIVFIYTSVCMSVLGMRGNLIDSNKCITVKVIRYQDNDAAHFTSSMCENQLKIECFDIRVTTTSKAR